MISKITPQKKSLILNPSLPVYCVFVVYLVDLLNGRICLFLCTSLPYTFNCVVNPPSVLPLALYTLLWLIPT